MNHPEHLSPEHMPSDQPYHRGYVAIIGKTNVGKSTLMNRLVGAKLSIVTSKPQTTRRRIIGIASGPSHQIIFLDTPGILTPRYGLQKRMLVAATRAIKEADLVLWMIDVSAGTSAAEECSLVLPRIGKGKAVVLALNKIDLVRKEKLLPLIDEYQKRVGPESIVPMSALTGDGVDRLVGEMVVRLPIGPPYYPPDTLTEHPERFFVSEIILEKIFERYGEEIPYSSCVEIEEFSERPERKDFIRANVYVEKKSQKAILIGRGGTALKKVGELARRDIEELLGRPVYLELWVKVRPGWRKSERDLRRLGY